MDVLELVCVILLVNKEGVDLINLGCCIVVVFDSDKMGMGVNDNLFYIYESQFSVFEIMMCIEQIFYMMGVFVFVKFDYGKNVEEVGL